jgi:hypothetical protein
MNREDSLTALHAPTDVAPSSPVVGRGRRRRRLMVASALTVLVALSVAVGIGTTFARPPELMPRPESAPSEFALNRLHLSVGWVPESDGYSSPPTVDLAPKAQRILYFKGATDLSQLREVSVWQFAAGVTPREVFRLPGHGPAEVVDAPAVNGRPAVYYRSDGKVYGIAWPWEGGAWAFVFRSSGVADNAEVLHRIAESVRTDLDEPVRLPFTVKAPEGGRLIRVSPTGGLTFALDEPSASDLDLDPYQNPATAGPRVTVSVVWSEGGQFDWWPRTTTIGGHPADLSSSYVGYHLVLFDVDGYLVEVRVNGVGASKRFSAEQVEALALSVEPLGPPSATSQWTDDPLR